MPSLCGIEGRYPYKAMNSPLRSKVSICMPSINLKGDASYSCFHIRKIIDKPYRKTFSFRPSSVHSVKHFRPILGIKPSSPRMDTYDSISFIMLVPQQQHELLL